MSVAMNNGARISECQRYRYSLMRDWREAAEVEPRAAVFAMLNPSTADAHEDDPTIRRCVGFARSWGCNGIEVVNLFAYRATKPRALLGLSIDEAVGPDNREHWERVVIEARRFGEPRVVAAWGALDRRLAHQAETALGWLDRWNVGVDCLGKTKAGHPRHPLYLSKATERLPLNEERAA